MSLFSAVSATAFYKCQPVNEFMAEVLRMRPEQLQENRPLRDADRLRFAREIKGNMCIQMFVFHLLTFFVQG